jgi:hypothetical protein
LSSGTVFLASTIVGTPLPPTTAAACRRHAWLGHHGTSPNHPQALVGVHEVPSVASPLSHRRRAAGRSKTASSRAPLSKFVTRDFEFIFEERKGPFVKSMTQMNSALKDLFVLSLLKLQKFIIRRKIIK